MTHKKARPNKWIATRGLDGTRPPKQVRYSIREVQGIKLKAEWAGGHTINIYARVEGDDWENVNCVSIGDFAKNHATGEDWKEFLTEEWHDNEKALRLALFIR